MKLVKIHKTTHQKLLFIAQQCIWDYLDQFIQIGEKYERVNIPFMVAIYISLTDKVHNGKVSDFSETG